MDDAKWNRFRQLISEWGKELPEYTVTGRIILPPTEAINMDTWIPEPFVFDLDRGWRPYHEIKDFIWSFFAL